MTADEMLTAIRILSRYAPATRLAITAEHDQVWLSSYDGELDYDEDAVEYDEEEGETKLLNPSPLTAEEAKEMDEAGWFVDSETFTWTSFC